MLLAYYIAAVNIENTYHEAMREAGRKDGYEPFGGIVLTDTFQSSEPHDRQDTSLLPRNNERMERQLALDIRVILGNPPWSVGQGSANDDNQNHPYPALDGNKDGAHPSVNSIFVTYTKAAATGLKRALYDSHVRAIRWASNRVLASQDGGVIAFVTNSGFIDGKAFDGFRKTVVSEFDAIYIYNLRGNQRTSGEQSRREAGKIFGAGSRAGVALLLLVKRPSGDSSADATIQYRDIGDYLSREQKLSLVAESALSDEQWSPIAPNEHADWINQRSDRFLSLHPLSDMKGQPAGEAPILNLASRGVTTSRDAWVFNSSEAKLRHRIDEAVDFYNGQVEALGSGVPNVSRDPTKFSWDGTIESRLAKGQRIEVGSDGFRVASYRPFFRQHLYLDRALNNSVYQLPRIFPSSTSRTHFILIETKLHAPDRVPGILAMDVPADIKAVSGAVGFAAVGFPRYVYGAGQVGQANFEEDAVDNVKDDAVSRFQASYGDAVTNDHIFAYVYGILHSPDYRERYAIDLSKMLPRIPEVASADDFFAFAEAGQRLLDLHIGYEKAEPYPLHEQVAIGAPDGDARWRVEKMKWGGNRKQPDRSTIIVDDWVTLSGIPDEAHRYVVGPRTALEWLIDRYRIRVDKASGIVNDVNDWGLELDPPNPRYIVDLIKRVTTVSFETMNIIDSLPPLREADD